MFLTLAKSKLKSDTILRERFWAAGWVTSQTRSFYSKQPISHRDSSRFNWHNRQDLIRHVPGICFVQQTTEIGLSVHPPEPSFIGFLPRYRSPCPPSSSNPIRANPTRPK